MPSKVYLWPLSSLEIHHCRERDGTSSKNIFFVQVQVYQNSGPILSQRTDACLSFIMEIFYRNTRVMRLAHHFQSNIVCSFLSREHPLLAMNMVQHEL